MRSRLRKLWESRAPRERLLISMLVIVLGASSYLWLLKSADQARTRLRSSVPMLRIQAGELEQHASEYESLSIPPRPPLSPSDLRNLMQVQADAAGISHALADIDALGSNQVQVVFRGVPFEEWLDWVAAMQLQYVRLNSGRIEALPESGMVSVAATFVIAE